jgi:hypothetical protein
MSHEELIKLLQDNGFEDGYCLAGDILTLWFHDAEPPAPLTRPTETTGEAVITDAQRLPDAE